MLATTGVLEKDVVAASVLELCSEVVRLSELLVLRAALENEDEVVALVVELDDVDVEVSEDVEVGAAVIAAGVGIDVEFNSEDEDVVSGSGLTITVDMDTEGEVEDSGRSPPLGIADSPPMPVELALVVDSGRAGGRVVDVTEVVDVDTGAAVVVITEVVDVSDVVDTVTEVIDVVEEVRPPDVTLSVDPSSALVGSASGPAVTAIAKAAFTA